MVKFKISSLLLVGSLVLSGCEVAMPSFDKAPESQTREVAAAALQVGDMQEAARLYERALEQHPGDVASLIGIGRSYTSMGQYNRAGNALSQAKSAAPRNPEVHNALGALALHRLQPAEALVHYSEAVSLDRDNLSGLTGKAISLDYMSRHTEAEAVYRDALRYHPTNFALLNNRALSLVLSGRIGEGTVLLQELVRDPQRGETARVNMAIAYALDGRDRDARAMLTKVMSATEVDAAMKHYATLRHNYQAGKPVGYLAFQ